MWRERARPIVVAVAAALAAARSFAAAPVGEILGTWRGTSVCVKSPEFPACHDEVVVYEFRKSASGGDAVALAAYKIVDGEKGLMGEFDLTYDAKQGAWTAEFQNPRYHGLWTYFVRKDELTGTLVDLPTKHVVRHISVRRENAPPE